MISEKRAGKTLLAGSLGLFSRPVVLLYLTLRGLTGWGLGWWYFLSRTLLLLAFFADLISDRQTVLSAGEDISIRRRLRAVPRLISR